MPAGESAQTSQQGSVGAYAPSGVHPPSPQKPGGSYLWAATGPNFSSHSSENLSPSASCLHTLSPLIILLC